MTKKVFRCDPKDKTEVLVRIRLFLVLLLRAYATIRIDHEFYDHGIVDVEIRYYIVEDTIKPELQQRIDSI